MLNMGYLCRMQGEGEGRNFITFLDMTSPSRLTPRARWCQAALT
jgi:hypothetical protein